MYIHELPDWPKMVWDVSGLSDSLAALRHQQGVLLGRMQALGFELQQEATLQTLTQDVTTTSAIEGELPRKLLPGAGSYTAWRTRYIGLDAVVYRLPRPGFGFVD